MVFRIEGRLRGGMDFVAGIVVRDNVVRRTAPIVKCMKGWKLSTVINHCNRKKWKLRKLGG